MKHHSLGGSIAFAESTSTVVALGVVWLITAQKNMVNFLAPAKEFVAKKIIYPFICGKPLPDGTIDSEENYMAKAREKASSLLKGVIMVGTDFAVTVAAQAIAEGDFSAHEFQKAAKGKGAGLGTTLVGLEALKVTMPKTMENFENKVIDSLPSCCKHESADGSDLKRELASFSIIAIPAAIISGIVSYMTQSRSH